MDDEAFLNLACPQCENPLRCYECGGQPFKAGDLSDLVDGLLPPRPPLVADPLSDLERIMLDSLLKQREHDTHRLTREDYLTNQGRRWREMHERRVLELNLRQRFGLPEHAFGACCEPGDDFHAEVATLGVLEHGVDVVAAEAVEDLE